MIDSRCALISALKGYLNDTNVKVDNMQRVGKSNKKAKGYIIEVDKIINDKMTKWRTHGVLYICERSIINALERGFARVADAAEVTVCSERKVEQSSHEGLRAVAGRSQLTATLGTGVAPRRRRKG